MRILVVDDRASNIELLKAFLQRKGHEILTAQSAGEAMDLLSEGTPPDLVLTDYDLGSSTGEDVAEFAKKRVSRKIKVILISGLERKIVHSDAFFLRDSNLFSNLENILA